MTRIRPITAVIGLGGLSVAAMLSGCAAHDAGSAGSGTPSGSTSGTYTDGDYSATGEYQSPGGSESIEVDITIADGIVSDVTVTGNASSGNAERYQSQFEEGIAAEVVGRNIDELAVDRVAGSSLTSDGFTDAIEQIKADALA